MTREGSGLYRDAQGRPWILGYHAPSATDPTGCVLVECGAKLAPYRGSVGDVIGAPPEIMREVERLWRRGLELLDVG